MLVVVSILAVMATSVVVGFGAFGNGLKSREALGMIEDTVKQAQMAVLKGDFQKVRIDFLADAVVVTETPIGTTLDLALDDGTCNQDFPQLTTSTGGTLTERDERDQSISVVTLDAPAPSSSTKSCVQGFASALEREWRYTLNGAGATSSTVRFTRFNFDTAFTLDPVSYRLELEAPYAGKRVYQKTAGVFAPVASGTLTLRDSEGQARGTLTL